MTLLEQPADWTEPGAFEVVPGVHRIPLPLAIDGLRAVNVYVMEGTDDTGGLTVIDSGWAGPESRSALDGALGGLGHSARDITQFLVTHAHWDHYTHALALRAEFGTPVRIGAGEQPSIDGFDLDAGSYPEQGARLARCGAVELASQVLALRASDQERAVPFGRPDAWLHDGEKVELSQRSLQVVATPGHTRGHIVFRDDDANLLFAGDHVLPHITPSIGLERAPEPAPLRSYLASLRLMRDHHDVVLLPAHGLPASSTHTRVDELLAHHEQRLAAIAAQVAAGCPNAFSIAGQLGWTRHKRRLADLDLMNQMMAVLEVQAHLDVLEVAGEALLAPPSEDGVARYTA